MYPAFFEINTDNSLAQDRRPRVSREQAANWSGDFRRAEDSHGHLVEQGLEEMVVALIDQCDLDISVPGQAPGRAETSESAPYNDYSLHAGPLRYG